ncbi:MAG: hypothetical protein EBR30_02200 [Cytophagia bacterium]|nr:hypothetical protein [Cytophagia bacterium]NBW33845.1 hypothetical protein [Cytophagia bacterium]
MQVFLSFVLWCILLVLCWPLALLLLLFFPLIWLITLPFRIVGFTFEWLFKLIGAILLLPFSLASKK